MNSTTVPDIRWCVTFCFSDCRNVHQKSGDAVSVNHWKISTILLLSHSPEPIERGSSTLSCMHDQPSRYLSPSFADLITKAVRMFGE